MKRFTSFVFIMFMVVTICICKTPSVEAKADIYFKIMNVDIQSQKCIVEGYFYNSGNSDGNVTSVQFYGPLTEKYGLDGSGKKKIRDINVSFSEYRLLVKANHKVYETFVILDDKFAGNPSEDNPYRLFTYIQNWDVKCKVYFR